MRVLVAGWFSFPQMGASAGDLLARDLACDWLKGAGYDHDVALAPPFMGGVDWRSIEPQDYGVVLFVCGPFGNGPPLSPFLERFQNCRLVGLNVSMLESLETWDPFDVLLERGSSRTSRPDMTFLATVPRVPVIGVVRIDAQPEYGGRDRHTLADAALDRLLAARDVATLTIDTRLDVGGSACRTPAQVESLMARADAVVTTRLHGLVLALKNEIPALAIDSVLGGDKISLQAQTIGWPICFGVEDLDADALARAFDYCLTKQAREDARACAERACQSLSELRMELLRGMRLPT